MLTIGDRGPLYSLLLKIIVIRVFFFEPTEITMVTHRPSDIIPLMVASKAFLSHPPTTQAEPLGLIIKTPSSPGAAGNQGLGRL